MTNLQLCAPHNPRIGLWHIALLPIQPVCHLSHRVSLGGLQSPGLRPSLLPHVRSCAPHCPAAVTPCLPCLPMHLCRERQANAQMSQMKMSLRTASLVMLLGLLLCATSGEFPAVYWMWSRAELHSQQERPHTHHGHIDACTEPRLAAPYQRALAHLQSCMAGMMAGHPSCTAHLC